MFDKTPFHLSDTSERVHFFENLKFNGLSTFYANARSIVNKRSELEIDIATSRYDIIALTETLGQLYLR